MYRIVRSAVAAFAIAASVPATAATLLVDGGGKLVGATDVFVLGTAYNVSFVDGTCAALFGGCDDSSDFVFTSEIPALFAAQALELQVFFDAPGGPFFDSDYTLTSGCGPDPSNGVLSCDVLIPFALSVNPAFVQTATFFNGGVRPDETSPATGELISYDTANDAFQVYARFTLPTGSVPEPSTWAMMLLGFGAIGLSIRHVRRKVPATA
jgi:hypothetical protein